MGDSIGNCSFEEGLNLTLLPLLLPKKHTKLIRLSHYFSSSSAGVRVRVCERERTLKERRLINTVLNKIGIGGCFDLCGLVWFWDKRRMINSNICEEISKQGLHMWERRGNE